LKLPDSPLKDPFTHGRHKYCSKKKPAWHWHASRETLLIDEFELAWHAVHAVAAVCEKVAFAHGRHSSMSRSPLYVPASHGTHSSSDK
jgi:hypothetical protein